jgi:hypothetical protein
MGLSTDPERKARVVQRSWLLAMSGECADWRAVEARLLALGYFDAPRWLRDPELRRSMDSVCRTSRQALAAHASVASDAGGSERRER